MSHHDEPTPGPFYRSARSDLGQAMALLLANIAVDSNKHDVHNALTLAADELEHQVVAVEEKIAAQQTVIETLLRAAAPEPAQGAKEAASAKKTGK